MNAGLLFYFARKTSLCQKRLSRYTAYFELTVSSVKVCAKENGMRSAMAQLLGALPVVFVVGGAESNRPACARLLFEILRIPLDSNGEPKGVLRLKGVDKTGYLIESMNQAIAVLPDVPDELEAMLPQACERLKQKFSLSGEPPAESEIDYAALVENSMSHNNY